MWCVWSLCLDFCIEMMKRVIRFIKMRLIVRMFDMVMLNCCLGKIVIKIRFVKKFIINIEMKIMNNKIL